MNNVSVTATCWHTIAAVAKNIIKIFMRRQENYLNKQWKSV